MAKINPGTESEHHDNVERPFDDISFETISVNSLKKNQ